MYGCTGVNNPSSGFRIIKSSRVMLMRSYFHYSRLTYRTSMMTNRSRASKEERGMTTQVINHYFVLALVVADFLEVGCFGLLVV